VVLTVALDTGTRPVEATRPATAETTAAMIADDVERALVTELWTYPKPGLVSRVDSGAHDDMDHHTMMSSIVALRPYFERIADAGAERGTFTGELQPLGVDAERAMLHATSGINTHRGAIFCLGLLAAAAGRCSVDEGDRSPDRIRTALVEEWGDALDAHRRARRAAPSHGGSAFQRYGVGGAAGEAARGFPAVFDVGVPALQRAREAGLSVNDAHVQTLFELLAVVPDTNLLHRGGAEAGERVRMRAVRFLDHGGCLATGWWEEAERFHADLVAARLSPGGCADLLAATSFVLTSDEQR
jgi:triphosphoribosyl-dephospho-CoA synthase